MRRYDALALVRGNLSRVYQSQTCGEARSRTFRRQNADGLKLTNISWHPCRHPEALKTMDSWALPLMYVDLSIIPHQSFLRGQRTRPAVWAWDARCILFRYRVPLHYPLLSGTKVKSDGSMVTWARLGELFVGTVPSWWRNYDI